MLNLQVNDQNVFKKIRLIVIIRVVGSYNPSFTHLSQVKGAIDAGFVKHCSNMSRNSISFSQVAHIVFCCWYCEVETLERDKAAHLYPALWPWVPDRYKSVGAGRHSSEQVNRASSNPSGGPQTAGAQQRLLQMLTFANTNSLAFWKTKLPVSKRRRERERKRGGCEWQRAVLSGQHFLQPSPGGKLEGDFFIYFFLQESGPENWVAHIYCCLHPPANKRKQWSDCRVWR